MKARCVFVFFFSVSFASMAQLPAYTAILYDTSSVTGSQGYYFTDDGINLMILDKNGNLVYDKYNTSSLDFTLQPNGMMSYWSQADQSFLFMDSTFTVVDSISIKNLAQTDPHELQVLPNGHFLLLGNEYITMDLSQYNYFNHNGDPGSSTASVRCSVIQEQDSARNVVFEWHTADHFAFDDVDTFFLFSPTDVDWTHSNAIEMDNDGNILLCTRHLDEVTKINHSDSSIIWRLGGKQNQFTFINSPIPFYGQHDIRRISNGHVTIYDGGNHTIPHFARPLEFELDEPNHIATQQWSYVYDSAMHSNAMGNTQRLANSNTLVDYGITPIDSVCFVVVDSGGSKIFELDGMRSYRSFNFPSLPFQLHRPQISCFDSLSVTYLDAGAGYTSYLWNNGDTTRAIAIPAVATNYYVFVPYGQNGLISSEQFVVTDTSNSCGNVAAPQISFSNEERIMVFPDPATVQLTVAYHLSKNSDVTISLYDFSGRKIKQLKNEMEMEGDHSAFFDLAELADGFYFVKLNQHTMKFVKQ